MLKFGFETRWILLNQGTSQSGTLTYTSTAAFLNEQHGLRLLYRDSAAGAPAQDAVLRLMPGRMEGHVRT